MNLLDAVKAGGDKLPLQLLATSAKTGKTDLCLVMRQSKSNPGGFICMVNTAKGPQKIFRSGTSQMYTYTFPSKGASITSTKPNTIAVGSTSKHKCNCKLIDLLQAGCKCGGV